MKQEQTWSRALRAAMSLLLSAAVLLSALMAVSPALHQLLHNDASLPSHECVVTMLQKQQACADSPTPLLIGFTPLLTFALTPIPATSWSQVDYASAPSRAPPAVLL
jgi:hypothetical protein